MPLFYDIPTEALRRPSTGVHLVPCVLGQRSPKRVSSNKKQLQPALKPITKNCTSNAGLGAATVMPTGAGEVA